VEAGASIVGHTLHHDLDALGMPPGGLAEDRVFDVAFPVGEAGSEASDVGDAASPPPAVAASRQKGGGKAGRQARKEARAGPSPIASLKKMAKEQLDLEIHQGGGRHCAIQDAEVAMRLHLLKHPLA